MAKRIAKLVNIRPQVQIISSNFSTMYNEGVVVVSQPPTRRVVQINLYVRDDYDEDEDENEGVYSGNFFLSFPLMYFRIQYRKNFHKKQQHFTAMQLHVVFAASDNKSKAFIPPLPNIDDSMRVCIELPDQQFSNIDDLCKAVVACFWATDFNDGMYDAYEQYDMDSLLGDYRKWQKKTKKQPTWIPNGRSLKQVDGFNKDFFYGESFKKDMIPKDDDF